MAAHRANPLGINCISMAEEIQTHPEGVWKLTRWSPK